MKFLVIVAGCLLFVFGYFLIQWRFYNLPTESMTGVAIYCCFVALIWLLVFSIICSKRL